MTSTIQIYNALRQQIGDQQAEIVTSFIEAKIKEEVSRLAIARLQEQQKELATKGDIANTHLEIEKLRTESEKLRTELSVKIEAVKSDLVKWMFIFFASQLTIQTGIMLTFFKIFIH